MRFDRESYRKLYVAESAEHQLMALASRGLRDYLLRFSAEDGTLLPTTTDPIGDMMVVLRARPSDRKLVSTMLAELQRVGYLKIERKRLWIVRYEEAQEARSPGAKRQKKHRDKNKSGGGDTEGGGGSDDVTENVTPTVTDGVTNNADSNAHVTSPLIDLADEKRRKPPNPRAGGAPRPIVRAGLLDAKISAHDWLIPEDHCEYALGQGLSAQQYQDAVADFREKTARKGEAAWLSSILCRFIDARAERIDQKRESGTQRNVPDESFAAAAAAQQMRETFGDQP